MSQFRNLVVEGGGVKGIAYAGAIGVLEDKEILPDIQRVAGTSAGATTAALLALGVLVQRHCTVKVDKTADYCESTLVAYSRRYAREFLAF